jgi:glycerol-3-phosphate dehydrogenase
MASTAPHLVRPMPRLLPLLPGPAHVGLTDEAVEGPVPDVAVASDAEIDFLLEVIGGVFEEPVRREDIVGTYAGLRAAAARRRPHRRPVPPARGAEVVGRCGDGGRRQAHDQSPDGTGRH